MTDGSNPKPLTYRDAGVDIDAGEAVVDRIRSLVASTHRPGVLSDLGGYAGLFAMPGGIDQPVLVSGTDGVGTKLKVAFATGVHDTVGIDLVAMSVNDVVVTGARPLFFLDYFGTGRLDPGVAAEVIAGIAEGCRQAECALLGGETAELPGMYADGEYDLAGFAVGVSARAELIDGRTIVAGDRVIGLASTGLHSNGFSLARKALLEVLELDLAAVVPELGKTLGAELLTPTRIYVRTVARLRAVARIKGLAHITGGGLVENPPRILPEGLGLALHRSRWPVPPVFGLIARAGVPDAEMLRTFNLGVGMIVVVDAGDVPATLAAAREAGDTAWEIGEVVTVAPGEPVMRFPA
jgi:phosphoribosylformylglycinamidine cyclo-ligase